MLDYDKRDNPRATSKRARFLPLAGKKARPGLAIDTSFTRNAERVPKQIYPPPDPTHIAQHNFVSLDDIRALSQCRHANTSESVKRSPADAAYVRPGPGRLVTESHTQQHRASKSVQACIDELAPPPPYKNNQATSKNPVGFTPQANSRRARNEQFRRPQPLKLKTDISPADRRIPIGIALSPSTIRNYEFGLDSAVSRPPASPRDSTCQESTQSLKTPTIIITPAEEDFTRALAGLPLNSKRTNKHRRRSSFSSRLSHRLPKEGQDDQAPPVPPLPSFVGVRGTNLQSSEARGFPNRSDDRSFENQTSQHTDQFARATSREYDGSDEIPSACSWNSRRSASQAFVPTPRRSRGWWNLLTSPFSATSTSMTFFPSSSSVVEEAPSEHERHSVVASKMPGAWSHVVTSPLGDGEELRSAPPTEYSKHICLYPRLKTPRRSETAPGALDLGNAGLVNIYCTPSRGEASSYYDPKRNYPSLIEPLTLKDLIRGSHLDWSPSHRVYQKSRDVAQMDGATRDTDFKSIPLLASGKAALKYDNMTQSAKSSGPLHADHRIVENRGLGTAAFVREHGVPSPNAGYAEEDPRAWVDDQAVCQKKATQPLELETAELKRDEILRRRNDCRSSNHSLGSGTDSDECDSNSRGRSMTLDADMHPTATRNSVRSPKQYDTGARRGENDIKSRIPEGNVDHLNDFQGTSLSELSRKTSKMRPSDPTRYTELEESSRPGFESSPQQRDRNTSSSSMSRDSSPMTSQREYSNDAVWSSARVLYVEKGNGQQVCYEELESRNGSQKQKAGLRWYQRALGVVAVCGTFLIIAAAVIIFTLIPFRHVDMPVQAQWLNLSGFPPLPTGVATIVGPHLRNDVHDCVRAEALWSCAAGPKQHSLSTTESDQPNFRFLIRFRNGTLPEQSLQPTNMTTIKRDSGRAANAGALVKRSSWSNYLYTSSPAPPSEEDQVFLGRTSDQNSPPYNGYETPFYISLLDPISLQLDKRSKLQKRDFQYPYPSPPKSSVVSVTASQSSSSVLHSSTPSVSHAIGPGRSVPQPSLQEDGKPGPPELYPFAYAQPLQLFNRGQQTEHYGFYTYFDRSVYVSVKSNGSLTDSLRRGEFLSGNVRRENANAVCTWSQSRLLVQIWTAKPYVTGLQNTENASSLPAADSTANDMKIPGSFPYAVTITLDRHGGDESTKGVYCHGLDEDGRASSTVSTWIDENRAVAGTIVNPAEIPTNHGAGWTKRDAGYAGGIDGGSGGCTCQWQNF